MPEKICPYCQEPFDANSLETESCRKTKCVKANQRAKKRAEAGVTEVKRGRPKSHVVLLKERTKERILGKAQGHSSAPSAGSDLPVPDVPPDVKSALELHASTVTERDDGGLLFQTLEDTTAGLPAEALPEPPTTDALFASEPKRLMDALEKAGLKEKFLHPSPEDYIPKLAPFPHGMGNTVRLPIQHHGTENDLAKSVISKVPATKLDPNSPEAELARLEKSQLRNTKKKES